MNCWGRSYIFILTLSIGVLLIAHCMIYAAADNKNQQNTKLALSGEVKDGVRIIKVEAARYSFLPDPIVVKLGEKVRLIGHSRDVTHGLAISDFKINLIIPSGGKTESVEFVANKEGVFNIICSVYCGSGHQKMQGTLIVLIVN